MRKLALISGAAAGLVLLAGPASAQSCSTEVDILQRQLGFEQGTNARIGPTDPGVQQPSPMANVTGNYDTEPSADARNAGDPWDRPNTGANATIGPNDPGVQQPSPTQHDVTQLDESPRTDADGDPWDRPSTGANATIGPNDPGLQQPQPAKQHEQVFGSKAGSGSYSGQTIAEASRSGEMVDMEVNDRIAALTNLRQAELYAQYGQDQACQNALAKAKQYLGVY